MGLKQTEQTALLFSHVFMREFKHYLSKTQHCLFLTSSVVGKADEEEGKVSVGEMKVGG